VNKAAKLIVTGAGTGYLPLAPGTWGALAVCGIYCGLFYGAMTVLHGRGIPQDQCPATANVAVSLMMLSLAVLASVACAALGPAAEAAFGRTDPRQCTIDEWAGQAVALLFLPIGQARVWQGAAAAFVAFRVMDIVKPPPARMLEKLPSGWGVLLDDLAAGVYANVAAQVALRLIAGWLGNAPSPGPS
jgi:phosphatidylglycerophosphatase A